jgi:hypothetical protein
MERLWATQTVAIGSTDTIDSKIGGAPAPQSLALDRRHWRTRLALA